MRGRQIGSASSAEAQLLYEISKQLDQLIKIMKAVKGNTNSPTTTTTTTT